MKRTLPLLRLGVCQPRHYFSSPPTPRNLNIPERSSRRQLPHQRESERELKSYYRHRHRNQWQRPQQQSHHHRLRYTSSAQFGFYHPHHPSSTSTLFFVCDASPNRQIAATAQTMFLLWRNDEMSIPCKHPVPSSAFAIPTRRRPLSMRHLSFDTREDFLWQERARGTASNLID